ncbi:MAG: penicillin-binding protein activator, partial [Pseudomonadota bacterium]
DEGVDAVIGPLDRGQIAPLLELPDTGLTILLLNRPSAPSAFIPETEPARSVAILALPPEEEAELAAVRALVENHRRALVIARSSDWGARVANRFIETFELGGGRVLARADYDAQTFDHTDQLEVLLRLDRSQRRIDTLAEVLGQPVEAQARRRTDADLIFMAAPGGDARQIKPQLRFLDAGNLTTFATSHVYSDGRNDRDLQDIEFPASPWLLQDTVAGGLRQQVEQQFPGLSSLALSQLHALGRDALALLPWLDEMKRDRQLYLAGQVGRLRLSDGVLFERDLPWARIDQGRIVEYTEPQ